MEASYSSIVLDGGDFSSKSWTAPSRARPPRLLVVASLERPYKGVDIAIEALWQLRAWGCLAHLTIAGGGRLRAELEGMAADYGLTGALRFVGHVPAGQSVRGLIDASDLILVPSRTEGLPRIALEAMARGRVCLTSTAGGLPEITHPEAIIESLGAVPLACRIASLWGAPDKMEEIAAHNLDRSHDFEHRVLSARRREFFAAIRESRPGPCM